MHAAQVAREKVQRVDCIRGYESGVENLIHRVKSEEPGVFFLFRAAHAVPSEGRRGFMDGFKANGQFFETRTRSWPQSCCQSTAASRAMLPRGF
jgi:hypothetical protein